MMNSLSSFLCLKYFKQGLECFISRCLQCCALGQVSVFVFILVGTRCCPVQRQPGKDESHMVNVVKETNAEQVSFISAKRLKTQSPPTVPIHLILNPGDLRRAFPG